MLFDGLDPLVRTLIVGTLAYTGLVVLLRLSGKRTLSKWNAFDFVVTVAYGSMLATILLSAETSLATGLAGLALLVVLQAAITWLSSRWTSLRRVVKARPTLLLYRGRLLDAALRRERVARDEVLAAVRSNGHAAVEEVEAVVLETDGSFSVMGSIDGSSDTALADVDGYDEAVRRLGGGA
ncbi:MAG TPA: YetF domain-containing protein, partial [Thermoanaerobaculia bacterium]